MSLPPIQPERSNRQSEPMIETPISGNLEGHKVTKKSKLQTFFQAIKKFFLDLFATCFSKAPSPPPKPLIPEEVRKLSPEEALPLPLPQNPLQPETPMIPATPEIRVEIRQAEAPKKEPEPILKNVEKPQDEIIPQEGSYLTFDEFEKIKDECRPAPNLNIGDIVLLKRSASGGEGLSNIQWVKIIGKQGSNYVFMNEGRESLKPFKFFYKLKQATPLLNSPALRHVRDSLPIEKPPQIALDPAIPEREMEPIPGEELDGEHIRTVQMRNNLLDFGDRYKNGLLRFNNVFYTPLSGNAEDISTKPTASCGSSATREVVLLNPDKSPLLNKHFERLVQKLIKLEKNHGPLNEETKLFVILRYIRKNIFPACKDDNIVEKTNEFVKKTPMKQRVPVKKYQVPIIPIDAFIQANVGVCRHHGMVAAYLIDKLCKNPADKPMLNGIVQHMRDNIKREGAHVWITYVNGTNKFHLDTLWGVLTDFSKSDNIEKLKQAYGNAAITNQIRRTEKAHEKAKKFQ